jgi:hypothetical protein
MLNTILCLAHYCSGHIVVLSGKAEEEPRLTTPSGAVPLTAVIRPPAYVWRSDLEKLGFPAVRPI